MSAPKTRTSSKKEESGTSVSQPNQENRTYSCKMGYATTMSTICVREGHSKDSRVLTILECRSVVFVLETRGNRAKIYFRGQEVGWCTIFFEKKQIFLLSHCKNQSKGKILFDAQDIDPVDIYEQEYDDYEHLFPYCENVKMNKLKTKRQKSKDFKRLQHVCQTNKIDNSRRKPNWRKWNGSFLDGILKSSACDEINVYEHEIDTLFVQYLYNLLKRIVRKIVTCIEELTMIEKELIAQFKNIINQIKDEKLKKNRDKAELLNEVVKALMSVKTNSRRDTPQIRRFGSYDCGDLNLEKLPGCFEKYNNGARYIERMCGICCDTDNVESLIVIHENSGEGLRCDICEACLETYVKMMLGKELKQCPCMGCTRGFSLYTLKGIATPELFNTYKESMWVSKLKVCQDFRFCPNENCGAGFQLPYDCCEVDHITCPSCDYEFCPKCYGPNHSGAGTCFEFLSLNHNHEQECVHNISETKQCPFCLVWIEKNRGCNHMTCNHCHNEFCWSCMGDYYKNTGGYGEVCHRRVIRPGVKELALSAKFGCPRMHGIEPMFVKQYYNRNSDITCAECDKKCSGFDPVYGCKRCHHYVCRECAGDENNKSSFLCILIRDTIVRDQPSLRSQIKYVLKKGTIVLVKDICDERRPTYRYRYNGYYSRRYRRHVVTRAKVKFCHFKSSYGWCSINTDNGHLLEPHANQEQAMQIFKTQNWKNTPLYCSLEIIQKIVQDNKGKPKPKQDTCIKKLVLKEEGEVFMPGPKAYSNGVLTQSRASKTFRKRNYYKTRRRGKYDIPAKMILKTRSRKRQNCRDHKLITSFDL